MPEYDCEDCDDTEVEEVLPDFYWITADGEGFGFTEEGEPPDDATIVDYREWAARKAAAERKAAEELEANTTDD